MALFSTGSVGIVRVLTTNGGPHEARRWARLTASMVAETDAHSAAPEKVEKFRELIAEALESFFRKPRTVDARAAFAQVKDIFATSPWASAMDAPEVGARILEVIGRNLTTAAADQGAY